MVNIIKPDFEFTDRRGTIVQLVHEGYKQINVITSAKGVSRGGHFHKLNREAFYIISGRLKLTVSADGFSEVYEFGSGYFFGIEPYDLHSFEFMEDTVLVSMYDNGVELENGQKDMYQE